MVLALKAMHKKIDGVLYLIMCWIDIKIIKRSPECNYKARFVDAVQSSLWHVVEVLS
jgi:hypothetical protein